MYKSKLQQLCQRRSWELPQYTTVKDGPNHQPSYTASVTVHGEAFESPEQCKSAKEAQNTAAKIAFDHFYVPPPPPRIVLRSNPEAVSSVVPVAHPPETVPPVPVPVQPIGLLSTNNDTDTKPANGDKLPQSNEDTTGFIVICRKSVGMDDKNDKETIVMYKNRLQQYAQKHNLGFPVYSCESYGPPHARRFKSRVSLDGKLYETVEFFSTVKEAEQASAKVACQAMAIDGLQEDEGLYKNLLQEFVLKKGLLCPTYETVSSVMSRKPTYVSTVEISSETFRGDEAKTKKQAELSAAKLAYITLKERFSAKESSIVSSAVAHNLALTMKPNATIIKHQDATDAQMPAKRAKSSPEKMNVNSSPDYSDLVSYEAENSTSAVSIAEKPVENRPVRTKTVVFPRKLNIPIPKGTTVMPYSDDEWVAYKIQLR